MWEDCSHRIEALNLLLDMAGELEKGLISAKKLVYAEEFESAIDSIDELLQTFVDSISRYPQIPPSHPNINTLDLKMMNFRLDELRLMLNDIDSVKQMLKKLFEEGLQDKVEVLNQAVSAVDDYLAKLKSLCSDVSFLSQLQLKGPCFA